MHQTTALAFAVVLGLGACQRDDAAQPIQYDDAARLAQLNARIARMTGSTAQPPRWNPGDPFGSRFAK